MILLNGITGFYEKQNVPPNTDGMQFKKLCFSIINQNKGTILNFRESQVATNFFAMEVKVSNKYFYILLNAHYPFLAFASAVNFGEINFLDVPQLKEEFSPFYIVLSTSELNEPLILKSENKLNSAELKQIAYWKPNRIGEVLFNHWD
ncbi:hypothetical protein ACFVR2_22335 [Gottfriedia sp. NPDC057991]|uniref:hypothetical protein n=1 Tax=Gottfriedia sp. NPDC057991 TaxID=3346298 RepID=UPI0036DA2686